MIKHSTKREDPSSQQNCGETKHACKSQKQDIAKHEKPLEENEMSTFDKDLKLSRLQMGCVYCALETPALRVLYPKSNIVVEGQTRDLSIPVDKRIWLSV